MRSPSTKTLPDPKPVEGHFFRRSLVPRTSPKGDTDEGFPKPEKKTQPRETEKIGRDNRGKERVSGKQKKVKTQRVTEVT